MNRVTAWVLFDFANSTYSAVIAAVVFPVYYATAIVGNEQGLGDLWWGRAVSLSMLIVAVTSPFMGGIADISGRRKLFLIVYTFFALTAVTLFTTLREGMIVYGFVLAVIANVCVEGGLVFYNSYLPVIAPKEEVGKISAQGYAIGYLGSILSLLIALYLIKANMITAVWIEVSLLFGFFSIPLFLWMPPDTGNNGIFPAARRGFGQAGQTLKYLMRKRDSLFFVLAYFLYTDGVDTVIVFSSIFAVTTLGFTSKEVILLFLIVQVSAFIGAFGISRPIGQWGPKKVVTGSLFVWIAVVTAAYFVQTKYQYMAVAVLAGFVLGTVQAGSRALYTHFIPQGREAEFFGVYSTVGKTSSILGPLLFGTISRVFQNQRPAILSVAVLFLSGLVLLSFVREKH